MSIPISAAGFPGSNESQELTQSRLLLQKQSFLRRVELTEETRNDKPAWVLTGNTFTYYAKQIAQHTILELAGRARVAIVNEIEVSSSSG